MPSSTDMWVDSYRLLILPLASEAVSCLARDLNMDLWTFSRRNTPFLNFQQRSCDVLISIQGGRAANEITGVFLLGWGLQTHCSIGEIFQFCRRLTSESFIALPSSSPPYKILFSFSFYR
ncbi:hypothetical protein CEXT_523641 [Caerostris extrusa]|uniref:Uncharacterized protein n=1 Tax=Caerostris extrusa TaxID=172846 RepID=A0AAV4REP1_CAEEX|nr:hypothetical protein CEXT_523641 [Caerostris extrusa]